jgi:hypothetical protein
MKSPQVIWRHALPALLVIVASTFLLAWRLQPWPDSPDAIFHLHRVRALVDAWSHGILYPRWFPDFAFGYGHPILHYYAPAFYIPPALLHWAGLELITAVRITLLLFYAAAGTAIYLLLYRHLPAAPTALAVAIYQTFPYRLYDLNVRGALPEFAAFLWLPLVAWGVIAVARASGPRSLARAIWWGSLAWAGLILTHNLSAFMALFLWLVAALLLLIWLLLQRSTSPQPAHLLARLFSHTVPQIAPLLLGALLAAPYWLPTLLEAPWVAIGSASGYSGYANHFAGWRTLWEPALLYPYPDAAAPLAPLPLYVGLLLLLATVALFLPAPTWQRSALAIGLAAALLCIWLSTSASALFWQLGEPILSKLQFPWRWYTPLALAVAITGALAGTVLQERARSLLPGWSSATLMLFLTLGLGLYSFAQLPAPPAPYSAEELDAHQMWAFDAAHGQVGATWTGEFLPRWVTAPRWTIGRAPEKSPDTGLPVRVEMQQLVQSYQTLTAEVTAPSEWTLTLHQFYFPAWQARVNGKPLPFHPQGELALAAVDLPAGSYPLAITWAPTFAIWLGRAGWLLGWLAGAWLVWQAMPRWATLFWVILLLLAAFAAFTPWQVARQVPAAADFGPARLVAGPPPLQAHAGTLASIPTTWLIQEPTALTLFIHIIDSAGQVVAQHDGPLGGPYSPSQRQLPGLLLPHLHQVPLPAQLAPGKYTMLIGLYPPGSAAEPLLPAGSGDPRVAIGALEIIAARAQPATAAP